MGQLTDRCLLLTSGVAGAGTRQKTQVEKAMSNTRIVRELIHKHESEEVSGYLIAVSQNKLPAQQSYFWGEPSRHKPGAGKARQLKTHQMHLRPPRARRSGVDAESLHENGRERRKCGHQRGLEKRNAAQKTGQVRSLRQEKHCYAVTVGEAGRRND